MSYSKSELMGMVRAEARRRGIDEGVAIAQIQQESGFNPFAVSSAGAQGLAQFMPATARRFRLSNPFDPVAAIKAWGDYMSLMLGMFNGRIDIALAGYNSGENRAEYKNAAAQGRLINWSVLPAGVQSQTQNYVNKIMANSQAVAGSTLRSVSDVAAQAANLAEENQSLIERIGVGGLVLGLAAIIIVGKIIHSQSDDYY